MAIRNLTTTTIGREFNHLRVANLEDFLACYPNNYDYYESPFKILADLEEQIKFENSPGVTILSAYKPDGDVIFDLVGLKEHGGLRIVEYEFRTFIS
jgi:hypothetical protein